MIHHDTCNNFVSRISFNFSSRKGHNQKRSSTVFIANTKLEKNTNICKYIQQFYLCYQLLIKKGCGTLKFRSFLLILDVKTINIAGK